MTTAEILWAEFGALAIASIGSAFILGALSHHRKDLHTRAQGAVRASIVMFYFSVAESSVGAALGWDLALRGTPVALVAVIGLVAMIVDLRNELHTHPQHGPLGHVTRVRRWGRRWRKGRPGPAVGPRRD